MPRFSLKFLVDDPVFEEEQPYELFNAVLKPGIKEPPQRTNCSYHVQAGVTVNDVRDMESGANLDEHGFTFVKHQTSCPLSAEHFENATDPHNPVVLSYLHEMIALVEQQLSPQKAICIDWRTCQVSYRNPGRPVDGESARGTISGSTARPTDALRFLTPRGRDRLESHLTQDELNKVDSGEWQADIINAWRPFEAVKTAPLVITDRRSVLRNDVVECHKVMPDRVVKNFYLKHRPYHQWYYLSDQTPDDVALFRSWTSTRGHGFADYSPHGAAIHFPVKHCRPRESVEVRMILLKAKSV